MEAPRDDNPPPSSPAGTPEGAERRRRRRRGGRDGGEKREGGPTLPEGAPPPPPVDWKPGERRAEGARPKREGRESHAPRREERSRDGRPREPRRPEAGRERAPRGRERGRDGEKKLEAPPAPVIAPKSRKEDFLVELGGGLLQSVSRSFYLTIALLPETLRAPISIGYLLARTLDTIADATKAAPAAARLEHLRAFAEAVKYGADAEAMARLRRDVTAKLPAGDEKTLLESAPRVLAWLESIAMPDRWEVRRVIFRIAHGQALDLVRFGDGREVKALANVGELDDY